VAAEPERGPSLLAILERYEWHEEAACRGEPDADLFFPDAGCIPAEGTLLARAGAYASASGL
jgi:hypothetical protein